MGLLDRLKKKKTDAGAADAAPPDQLMSEIMARYPSGPARRGSSKNPQAVIDQILIFDADDHWLGVFFGCGALGHPFELSFRCAKKPGETAPPPWFVEPVTRVANAIRDGASCAPGVKWRIGMPLGGPDSPYIGLLTLPDLELGQVEPDCLLQLVPVTSEEMDAHDDAFDEVCNRVEGDRSRMIGRY